MSQALSFSGGDEGASFERARARWIQRDLLRPRNQSHDVLYLLRNDRANKRKIGRCLMVGVETADWKDEGLLPARRRDFMIISTILEIQRSQGMNLDRPINKICFMCRRSWLLEEIGCGYVHTEIIATWGIVIHLVELAVRI